MTKQDIEEIVSDYNKATDQTINSARHQLYEMLQNLTDLVLDLQQNTEEIEKQHAESSKETTRYLIQIDKRISKLIEAIEKLTSGLNHKL